MPTIKGFGQGGPIGLMEVKSKIETYSLTDLNAEIEKRGISFVLTDGVKAQLKNKVKDFRNDDPEGLQRLLGLIKEREPKELVVAIAGFQGGNGSEERELRSAIERRLKEVGAPTNLLRIQPTSVGAIPINAEEAYQAGNESGVHLIVWGDWRTKANGETIFHPRIRVIQDSSKTPIGMSEERYYRLDLAHSNGLDIVESGAVKTSNLIAALIALSYYKKAEYEQATQVFKTIRESDAEVYFYLGNCSFYSGRNEEAESYFKKAVEIDHTSLEALNNLGMVRYLTGRSKEAIENFREALNLDSSSDKTLDNLGVALVETGEIEEGLGNIKKAADVNPANANAWYNYGAVLHNTNHIVRALDAFEHYLRLRPDDHETWTLCVGLVRRMGNDNGEKVREFLLKAIESDFHNGEYLWEFVRLVPLKNDAKELALYRRFQARLSRLDFGSNRTDSKDYLQDILRKSIAARISWLLVGLGQYREARQALAEIKLSPKELDRCDMRLVYRLLSDSAAGEKFAEPLRKAYYLTVYAHFFGRSYRGYLDPDVNAKELLDAYERLLRSQPSNLECLIGKGILQIEILDFTQRRRIDLGLENESPPILRKQNTKEVSDWSAHFANDAERTLERAYGLTRDTTLQSDLKLCIRRLTELGY